MRKRQWKKILSVVLALAMVFSMNTAAFAEKAVSDEAVTEQPAEAALEEEAAPAEEAAPEEEAAVIEEEAVSAEEAAPAEEPAEEAAEAAEEAAGYNWNTETADITARYCNYDASTVSTAQLKVYMSSNHIYVVSLDELPDGYTALLISGKDKDERIEEIHLTGKEEIIDSSLTKILLSGNGLSFSGKVVKDSDGAAVLPNNIKIAKDHIYVLAEGWMGISNDLGTKYTDDNTVIYPKTIVKMSVSYNDWTVSFDKAVNTLYDGNINKTIGESKDYAVGEAVKVPYGITWAESKRYVKLADGGYGRVTYNPATDSINAEKQATVTTTTISSATFNILNGSYADVAWTWVEGNPDPSHVSGDKVLQAALDSTNGWTKAKGTGNVLSGLEKNKTYTIIVRNWQTTSFFASYVSTTFTTDNEMDGDWVATSNWKAFQNGTAKTVSVNTGNGNTVSICGLADTDPVTLVAGDNAEKLEDVFVDKDITVTLSANKRGVTLEGVRVFNGSTYKRAIKTQSGNIIVDSKGEAFAETEEDLEAGDRAYLPEVLSLGKEISVDYDLGQASISSNGKILFKDGSDTGITFVKDRKFDVEKIVASENLIFDYTGVAESAYQYGTVAKFGEWGDAVTEATVDEGDITARWFAFLKEDNHSYALTASKTSNVKTLSWDVLDALSKVEGSVVTVTSENAAEEGKTEDLLPGGTYYLYTKGPKAEGKFTRYAQEPAEVTLGAIKNIVIKPRHNGKKIVLSNDDVTKNDFEIFVDSVSVVSVNGADFDFDKEINPVGLGLTYYLSGNNLETERELTDSSTSVKGGTYTLTVSGVPTGSDAKKKGYRKNEYNITYAPGEFYVGSADSKLVVTTKGSYYFGQSVGEKTVGEDNFFDVRLDGKSGAYKWDALNAEVSANAFTTGGAAPGTVDSTTSANGSFYVKFYSKASSTISSGDATRVEVTARPVYIGAKYNFFKKTGDDVSAEKVAKADLELFDVEEGREVSYYIKGDLAIDPSSVISTDESAVARKYMLSVSGNDYATKEVSENAANGNYIITAGAAEGYAYYVFPVYKATFNGQFKSAKYEGETISSGDVKSVSSDSAKRIEEYKGQERKKDISYTTTAVVNMPEDIVVNGEFMGWKSDLSQERISGKTDTISNDVIYTATVKSRIPGFTSSENSLMVEFDADNAVYTGMKHVTNPVEQMENYASEAGRMNALTTLVDNANKGTPDITLNIYVGGRLLLEGYDYKAVYKNNINAFDYAADGVTRKTPQVTVTFRGGYKQYPSFTRYFGIKRANICDGALVLGTPTESRYYKKGTNASKVKPGLYNVNTGAGLVLNNNGKKDLKLDIINSNDKAETGKLGAGDYRVVITGTNNYDGKIEDAVISVKSTADFGEVKLKANVKKKMDFEQVLSRIDMDSYIIATEDDKWLRAGIIEAMGRTTKTRNLSADSLEFDLSMASRVKSQDYSTPGTKKISYKAYLPVENSEKVYVLKGTFQYIINKAEASKISISWAEIPEKGVPYVPTGATLNFTSTQYNGIDADLTKIIKVAYSNNKNPGKTAKATVKAVKGAYVNGKLTGLAKEFPVGKAVISDNNVALAYIVEADRTKGTAAKIQSAVAKRNSFVIKDDLGNVLNAGSDYDLELGPKTESGNTVSINIACKGKKYEGNFTVNGRVLDTNFLGKLKLKNKGAGSAKNFSEAEMKSLEGVVSADEVNRIAADHKIDVYDGTKALQGAGKDYNIVITPAGKDGWAYVTAVGIDGGAYGGSDVLASAAIKVKVKYK